MMINNNNDNNKFIGEERDTADGWLCRFFALKSSSLVIQR